MRVGLGILRAGDIGNLCSIHLSGQATLFAWLHQEMYVHVLRERTSAAAQARAGRNTIWMISPYRRFSPEVNQTATSQQFPAQPLWDPIEESARYSTVPVLLQYQRSRQETQIRKYRRVVEGLPNSCLTSIKQTTEITLTKNHDLSYAISIGRNDKSIASGSPSIASRAENRQIPRLHRTVARMTSCQWKTIREPCTQPHR